MKRVITAFLLLATTISASAQVSYQQMLRERNAQAPRYEHPQSITPVEGTNKYMRINFNRVLLYDYTSADNGVEVFAANNQLLSFVQSPDGSMVLYDELNDDGSTPRKQIYRHSFTSDFKLWVGDKRNSTVATFGDVRDVTFSPDSRHLAMSFDNNLYIYTIADDKLTKITDDGRWNHIINGTTDWVYEEEYGFTKAYAFSPDSREIAFLKFDESRVREFEMMRYDKELYNKAFRFKYPKAGEDNSIVELYVYDIASGAIRHIPTGNTTNQYIPRVGYTPAGALFYYRVNRLQNHFEVVMVEDDGSQRVIYDERDEKYVERPDHKTITFIDGDRFIVREETSAGWFHLYLHSTERGRLGAITTGEWEVTKLVGVSADKNTIYYLSTEQAPEERHLYAIGIDGKNKRCLLSKRGYWSVYPSADMSYFAAEHSATDCYPTAAVYDATGKEVRSLMVDAPTTATPTYQRKYSSFTTERGDVLSYYLIYPEDFDAERKYPVLMTQYSGPGSQEIGNRWTTDWEETLARNGYIVACCDARGTGYRGEAFKKVTYANLGYNEVEDQLSFARHLASQSFIDSERIGIYGWSFGGFMALGCSLKGDGMFKMAIAVAPVTSWRYYDSIYTEIYNGLPQDNAAGYDNNSPINFADRLSDDTRLLIIHGTADDNVHFQNAMEMCRALNRAGKQYDMMVYPDQNHSMRPNDMINIREKMVSYCLEHL